MKKLILVTLTVLLIIIGNSCKKMMELSGSRYAPVPFAGPIDTSIRNLTATDPTSYYWGWPIAYAVGNKRGFLYRRGDRHEFSAGSSMVRFETSDGGFNWTRTVELTEPEIDSRNYGGGNTSRGVVCVFYGRWSAGGTIWQSIRCLRTDDDWSTKTISADLPLYNSVKQNFSPHGRMIELEDGTLMQAFYGDSTDKAMSLYLVLKKH